MRMLIVAGDFNESGGRPSGVAKKMHECLQERCLVDIVNGGDMNTLTDVSTFCSSRDVLIWMPNISNDVEKILPSIKKKNKKLVLVSSKNMMEKDYQLSDVVGHLLKNHSNLGIAVDRPMDKFRFRVIDPLGNIFVNTEDINELCKALWARIFVLVGVQRMSAVEDFIELDDVFLHGVSDEFISIVRRYADIFSKHVNAVNPNRLLGNASTRCQAGFPSARVSKIGSKCFVSRRNIDKASIGKDGFVLAWNDADKEYYRYFGSNKPSVDSPIQLKLYQYYKNIKYMIHGHVYVLYNAKMTDGLHPCGSLEEVSEIIKLFPDPDTKSFVVNLKGHGCLAACDDLEYFNKIEFCSRPFPEGHGVE